MKVDDILQDRKFTKVCGNLTTDEIIHIVNTNDKQRFQLKFSSSLYIAASQGHTIEVSNYMPLCNPACNTNVLLPEVESSRTSLASRTDFEVLGLGLEGQVLGLGLKASSPRKLACPRLEDSTIFWNIKILWSG